VTYVANLTMAGETTGSYFPETILYVSPCV